MRRAAILFVLVGIAAACWPLATDAGPTPPFRLQPIVAYFYPQIFATKYHAESENGYPSRYWTHDRVYEWSLRLEIVDKDAGKPYPGLPGSGGAVDLGCTNDGVGIEKPVETVDLKAGEDRGGWYDGKPFEWHHPDAADSDPPGRYHCNHNDMGPHGHQGVITLVVTEGRYRCVEHYGGTNDGKGGAPSCAWLKP